MLGSRMEPLGEEVGEAQVMLNYHSGHIGKCLTCSWSCLKFFTGMNLFYPHNMPVKLVLQPPPFIVSGGTERQSGPALHSESLRWTRT